MKIIGAGKTDIGRIRQVNQDSILVDNDLRLFLVADGMGGHAGGEVASQLCAHQVRRVLAEHLPAITNHKSDGDLRVCGTLAKAINSASTTIYERALEEPQLRGMGTTATAALLYQDLLYWAHVGDSRLYLLRNHFLFQLTQDHSFVGEQVRTGIMTREEAEHHHLKNIITRCVGYQEEEDVDTGFIKIEPGDFYLLCSDGLHGRVPEREISHSCLNLGIQAVDPLIQLANQYGGDDNISVILVQTQDS